MIQSAKIPRSQYVFEFREQIKSLNGCDTKCLIIAHPDDRMISKIQSVCSIQDVAVATIPQPSWDFASECFVEWEPCLQQFESIVLAGTSQGGTNDILWSARKRFLNSEGEESQATSNQVRNPILNRAMQAVSLVKQNEQYFAEQLQAIQNHPAIAVELTRKPNLISGLFYRVESGSFCQFDFASQSLQPLSKV